MTDLILWDSLNTNLIDFINNKANELIDDFLLKNNLTMADVEILPVIDAERIFQKIVVKKLGDTIDFLGYSKNLLVLNVEDLIEDYVIMNGTGDPKDGPAGVINAR